MCSKSDLTDSILSPQYEPQNPVSHRIYAVSYPHSVRTETRGVQGCLNGIETIKINHKKYRKDQHSTITKIETLLKQYIFKTIHIDHYILVHGQWSSFSQTVSNLNSPLLDITVSNSRYEGAHNLSDLTPTNWTSIIVLPRFNSTESAMTKQQNQSQSESAKWFK